MGLLPAAKENGTRDLTAHQGIFSPEDAARHLSGAARERASSPDISGIVAAENGPSHPINVPIPEMTVQEFLRREDPEGSLTQTIIMSRTPDGQRDPLIRKAVQTIERRLGNVVLCRQDIPKKQGNQRWGSAITTYFYSGVDALNENADEVEIALARAEAARREAERKAAEAQRIAEAQAETERLAREAQDRKDEQHRRVRRIGLIAAAGLVVVTGGAGTYLYLNQGDSNQSATALSAPVALPGGEHCSATGKLTMQSKYRGDEFAAMQDEFGNTAKKGFTYTAKDVAKGSVWKQIVIGQFNQNAPTNVKAQNLKPGDTAIVPINCSK
jgi:hypothetical protein